MNNIFQIDKDFNFSLINLANPSIINNSNHICKITHGDTGKNLYIQLPKCTTKNGIVKSNNRIYCDLVYKSSDKEIIEFFEKLEATIVENIFKNRDTWFYEGNNMSREDISELIIPILRSYKSGKCFIVRQNIKNDKLLIYNEDQKKIALDDLEDNVEIVPLINISCVKFSSKSINIESNLVQIMVIMPSDEFENQILINLSNPKGKTDNHREIQSHTITDKNVVTENDNILDNSINILTHDKTHDKTDDKIDDKTDDKIDDKTGKESNNARKVKENGDINNMNIENSSFNNVSLDSLEINSLETIKLKDKNEVYLELYYEAVRKAKEIRKNAIDAFLHAKSIKTQYNLDDYIDSSSESYNNDSDNDSDNDIDNDSKLIETKDL